MQACLDRIDAVDGSINAFVGIDREDALAKRRADERLAKGTTHRAAAARRADFAQGHFCVKDQPANCSSKILGNFRSPYDGTVVQKLREAGAVIFGRVNMDEFAMGSSTENSAFGPTGKPWMPSACRAAPAKLRCRGLGAGMFRQHRYRHRWFHSPAGRALAARRRQADLRPGIALRRGCVRLVARPSRPDGQNRSRHGDAAWHRRA